MLRPTLAALLMFLPGAGKALDPDPARVEAALSPRMEAAVAAGFSGNVLVAHDGHVLFEHSYGLADPAAGTPVTPDTRFNLASTGKLFTIVAVMQLVQQGKLDLDAPVGQYLPDWPVATVREQVTPRHLLMHTSGLGLYWGAAFDARRPSLQRLSDHLPLLSAEPAFPPGTGWRYSNVGYQLLGLLVEKLSGEDYHDYVARHVFAPAGMADSGFFAMDGRAEGVAVPRRGGTGPDRDQRLPMPEPRGGAAGGGYSTARDLLRFHRALVGGALLDEATLQLMFAPVVLPAGTRAPPHGLGGLRYEADGHVVYGHPGGAPGVGVDFLATRDDDWAIVVMGNTGNPRSMPLTQELLGLLATAGAPDLRMPMFRTPPAGP